MTIYEDKGTEWILQGPFNINIEGMQSTLTAQHTYKRLSYLYKTYIYIYMPELYAGLWISTM